jgi:hypothetical protein
MTKVCPVHRFESQDLTYLKAQAYLYGMMSVKLAFLVHPLYVKTSDALKKRHFFVLLSHRQSTQAC